MLGIERLDAKEVQIFRVTMADLQRQSGAAAQCPTLQNTLALEGTHHPLIIGSQCAQRVTRPLKSARVRAQCLAWGQCVWLVLPTTRAGRTNELTDKLL